MSPQGLQNDAKTALLLEKESMISRTKMAMQDELDALTFVDRREGPKEV